MKTELVKFHDTELLCIKDNEDVFVSVRNIADAIGLNAESAVRGIKNHKILGDVATEQYGRDAIGRQNLMTYLPIQYLHGWLFSIDIAKVKPEVQPRLEMFQRECYQVLYDHFFGKTKIVVKKSK